MKVTSVNVDRIIELTVEVAPGPQDNWSPQYRILVQVTAKGVDYDTRSSSLVTDNDHVYPPGFFDWVSTGLGAIPPMPVKDAITLANTLMDTQVALNKEAQL